MVKTHPKGNLAAKIKLLRNVKIMFSEVVFGTPGKRCEGSGLCRIYSITGAKRLAPHPRRLPAILLLNNTGKFTIRLNRNDLSQEIYEELFHEEHYTLEEQFVLPKYFARKLGIEQMNIEAGVYTLLHKGIWLDLVFKK